MNDFAHCNSCDKVINLDRDNWSTDGNNTYCADCKHNWYALEVDEDQPEQIYWCHDCDASKDSTGGIIA